VKRSIFEELNELLKESGFVSKLGYFTGWRLNFRLTDD